MTKISWAEKTWNPVTGCTKNSAGCKNCYAERMAKRLQAMGQPNYANGFDVTCHEHMLERPLKRKKPTMYFVCSMSDLFHSVVPISFQQKIFDVMRDCSQHTFQVLTKRPFNMRAFAGRYGKWPTNVWAGVSVESHAVTGRIDDLVKVPAPVRFLSCEPLLGPLFPDLNGVHWVIVGGESGPGARPMDVEWARSLRRQCAEMGIPFFFKQRGGKKVLGWDLLDGEKIQEWPNVGR
jgi:protein gp37